MPTIRRRFVRLSPSYINRHFIALQRIRALLRNQPATRMANLRQFEKATAKFSDVAWHVLEFVPDKATEPTSALPGTPEKIAVLRQRMESGQSLWHPLDAGVAFDRLYGIGTKGRSVKRRHWSVTDS